MILGNGSIVNGGVGPLPSDLSLVIINPTVNQDAGAGNFTGLYINPTINQSGTATGGYTALKVNAVETNVLGSSSLLADFQTNGVSRMAVTSAGNVGIGTTTPGFNLDVTGTGRFTSSVTGASFNAGGSTYGNGSVQASGQLTISAGGDNNLRFGNNANNTFIFRTGNPVSEVMRINPTGSVGIGTPTPSYLLHVSTADDTDVAGFTNANGTCTINPTSTALSCSSDERLKKNIAPLANSLEIINALHAVKFDWRNDSSNNSQRMGFIAQQVEAIAPQLVSTTQATGYKAVNYIGFVPLLVDAIQTQQTQILGVTTQMSTHQLRFDEFFMTADGQLAQITAAQNQAEVQGQTLADLQRRVETLEQHQSGSGATSSANVNSDFTLTYAPDLTQPTGIIGSVAEWTQDVFVFLKDIVVKGTAVFEGRVTFLADVVFKGRVVYEDTDTAGTIEFEPGEQFAEVIFENAYTEKPIVNLTAENGVEFVLYDVTANGFKVSLMSLSSETSVINWHAVSVKEANVTRGLPQAPALIPGVAPGSNEATTSAQASGSAVLGASSSAEVSGGSDAGVGAWVTAGQ